MNTLRDTPAPLWRLTQFVNKSDLATVCVLLVIMAILGLARSAHYLLFHTMAELFAIVVSFSIFMLTWVGQRYLTNGYLIVLGAGYGAIGLVDVFHTLTFKGMNLFPGVSTNYPTQFWLTARFLEALALFCAPFFIARKPGFYRVSLAFAVIACTTSLAVIGQWFPATFVDGVGLTAFKVYAEYLIIIMLLSGLALLYRCKSLFESRIFFLLVASLLLAVATEFCFTRYGSFYDFTNELGHYFRFLSVALAFMAIVISGVRQPMELIFREMEQSRRSLDELNTKLHASEDQFKQAQSVAKIGSWYLDIPNNVLTWSDETYRIFELPLGTAQSFDSFGSHIHPDDREAVFAAWSQAVQGKPYDIEHRIVVGKRVSWVREVAELTFAPDGKPLAGLGTVQDITERKLIESALKESEARMSAVFQASPIGIVISRLDDGKIIEVNDAGLRLYGYTREQALGRTVTETGTYAHPEQRTRLLQLLRELGHVDDFLIDFRNHDGAVGVLEMSGRIIELQGESCLLAMLTDVTERKRAEALIHDQAFHDALTHLPNRRLLANRLKQAMVAAKRSGCYGALMYLDLDNFKPLNDSHGHDVGDLLLIEVATRLQSCVREMDTVARVGGDEFVVMLSELHADLAQSTVQATTVAEKIRNALSRPYLLVLPRNGQADSTVEHHCSASIGVALFVNDEVSQDDMLNRADVAMYQAKRAGRNFVRFYDPS